MVKLLRKKSTKHTYLRVLSNEVLQISSNIYFTENDAKKLIKNKYEWIFKNLLKKEQNRVLENEFYFLGIKHKNLDERDIDKFYKNEAKNLIPKLIEKFSNEMNLFPTSIKYRKNKNTWGSCNFKNGLNFNTNLMKFPIEVIEYVVIHELAHIEHKNHSKRFWDLVFKYCPDYKQREKLLKSFL